jgi:hypothetical protein
METKKILDKNGLEYYTGKIKQQIPKKTSDLTNDSNFIDNTYHDSSKQNTLVSGTNIKTINNASILGSGNIDIEVGPCVEQSSTAPTDANVVLWIEDSDIDGSGGGGGTSTEVIDNLTSTSTTKALSANQGRVLNGKITTIEAKNLVESTNISKIVMVTEYPSTPDPDTLYVKVASL